MLSPRFLVASLALTAPLHAQQRFDETLVVTGTAEPAPAAETGRAVTIVTRQRIDALAVHDAADAVRLSGAVDVRSRGAAGVQSDFSIRGASFGQALVLVDGIRLNDAQTGHHNGDIPVPLADVERIEVLSGPGSALYGADALGGVIHVITRGSGPRLRAQLDAASFDALGAALSGRFGGEARGGALSMSARRSDGFTADRDHRLVDAAARFRPGRNTRLSLSHVDKEFGAAGFYGPAPSREWTRQTLAAVDHGFAARPKLAGQLTGFFRAHGDHFVYDRRNPALSDNRHDSRAAGAALRLHRALPGGDRLSAGLEAGADWLDSSSLGERGYGRASLFGEARLHAGRVTLRPGLRWDAYGRFGRALSPSLALAGPLRPGLRWRASGGAAFRVPTFTELYYQDPNHAASGRLRPERAWAADAGLELELGRRASASLTGFGRRERDVIDWVRSDAGERWRTANVRAARTAGVETALQLSARRALLRGRHTWLQTATPGLPLQSKYVLDFARHALGVDLIASAPGALRIAPSLEYRRKADGRHWWLLDARLSRTLGRLDVYLEGRNLLDARYQEIRGVEMPGRSLGVGVRAALPER